MKELSREELEREAERLKSHQRYVLKIRPISTGLILVTVVFLFAAAFSYLGSVPPATNSTTMTTNSSTIVITTPVHNRPVDVNLQYLGFVFLLIGVGAILIRKASLPRKRPRRLTDE